MYSIRIRLNQRLVTLGQEDRGSVGVLMRSGALQYFYWGGFVLHIERPVKLAVDFIPNEQRRNPRQPSNYFKDWLPLNSNEFLLGSYDGTLVKAYLPFTIVQKPSGVRD